MGQVKTRDERDAVISEIESLGQTIAQAIDWRNTNDPRIELISLAPKGVKIKVIPVVFRLATLHRPLRYTLDNEGDLYVGGEGSFGSQFGRKLILKGRSDDVLEAVVAVLRDLAPTESA